MPADAAPSPPGTGGPSPTGTLAPSAFLARWSHLDQRGATLAEIDATERAAGTTLSDDLKALTAALPDAPPKTLSEIAAPLCSTLLACTRHGARDIPRLAIHTLGHLFARVGHRLDHSLSRKALAVVVAHVVAPVQRINDHAASPEDRRLVSATLRALHWVLAEARGALYLTPPTAKSVDAIDTDALTTIVDALHWCIFRAKSNPWLAASTFRTVANSPTLRHAAVTRRRSAASVASPSPSDSDMSDADGAAREPAGKIRLNALTLLTTVAHAAGRHLFPHWDKFLGIDASSLLAVMKNDALPRVRTLAAVALAAMVEGAKPFLGMRSVAGHPVPTAPTGASFTSLSQKVAMWAAQVHAACLACVKHQPMPSAESVQLIKTFSTVAMTFDYSTRPTDLAAYVNALLDHAAGPDRLVAATALSSLADTLPQLSTTAIPAGVIDRILATATAPKSGAGPDAWRLVAHLAPSLYPAQLDSAWTATTTVFTALLATAEPAPAVPPRTTSPLAPPVVSPVLVCVESLVAAAAAQDHREADWWQAVLDTVILPLVTREVPGEWVASGWHCLASVPVAVLDGLPRPMQVLLMTTVLAHAAAPDEDGEGSGSETQAQVRAAACRAVGAMVVVPAWQEDDQFLHDAAHTLLSASTASSLPIRVRAAWGLANLGSLPTLPLPAPLLADMTHAALAASTDHDKCRASGVRALGVLYARLLSLDQRRPTSSLESQVMAALSKAIAAGPVKVRWNACRAAKCVLEAKSQFVQAERVVGALRKAMRVGKNFKVRIHAAAALGAVGSRVDVGVATEVVTELLELVDKEGGGGYVGAMAEYQRELVVAARAAADRVLAVMEKEDAGRVRQLRERWRELQAADGVEEGMRAISVRDDTDRDAP
ncbi:HEAT repeat-containing protein 6 [Allomyces arbusculus]|nr:HEAT repeat-containing protein 6 [Allomyces arbusculus]